MSAKQQSDKTSIIIGILISGFLLWQLVGYILPDKDDYTSGAALLKDVMEAHGGNEAWNSKTNIHFSKTFKLFKEDGSIEIDRNEVHDYTYGSSSEYLIRWQQDEDTFLLKKTESGIQQFVNDSLDALATSDKLLAKLNAARFVLDLPYSLNSDTAALEYVGKQEFEQQECHVLKVGFADSSDIWWLYFKDNDYQWLGYWVHTADHYSLVINEEMTVVDGFTLSRKRKSYRTDSLQNTTYLRATYEYGNYSID